MIIPALRASGGALWEIVGHWRGNDAFRRGVLAEHRRGPRRSARRMGQRSVVRLMSRPRCWSPSRGEPVQGVAQEGVAPPDGRLLVQVGAALSGIGPQEVAEV